MPNSFALALRRRILRLRLKSRQSLIAATVTIFVLFQIFSFRQGSVGWTPWNHQSILKPGDFLDYPTYNGVPNPTEDIIPDENILGITHDRRYNHLPVTLLEVRGLTWR
jgi:hypothetical protein